MPSTVYKGDLTEISFGHETGLVLKHGYADSFTFEHESTDAVAGTSKIKLASSTTAGLPMDGNQLRVPKGMLVGVKLSIIGTDNFTADDNTATGKIFTVVTHDGTREFDVTPALSTGTSTVSTGSDTLVFHPFTFPSIDVNAEPPTTNANASGESVLTDQFFGVTTAVTLPETRVDLKRYHVIGLGRDVSMQVPGRFINEGGSFEVNMHNPRWLYYCLGMEAVDIGTTYDALGDDNDYQLNGAVAAGASIITFTSAGAHGRAPTFASGSSAVTAGDYVIIKETATESIVSFKEGDQTAFGSVSNPQSTYFDTTEKSEIRRIVSITATQIFLDDPLCFAHASGISVRFARFNDGASAATGVDINNGSGYALNTTSAMNVDGEPGNQGFQVGDLVHLSDKTLVGTVTAVASGTITMSGGTLVALADDDELYNFNKHGSPDRASDGTLTKPVTRLLYSRSHVPSFAMEVSIRRRDNQADDGTTAEVVDGGTSDAKQLTRMFRGCKVKEFSLTADTDAALRLSVGFDSALCYTDTGRLETSNKGDRYNAHRIFEDTANTDQKRKEAGIAVGTQKPYMFYNGTITVAGVQIGQVVSFTVTGTTGVQQFYTINGAPIADAATDQVPFAGARNASIAVEGQTEYMADLEIIVDDPVFYHKMRRAVDHDATTANMIRLSFTKAGSAGTRESIDIYLDDYVITEAPLPIPEDKGPIRAPLKVMPKAIRVISTDTLFHC